MRRGYRGVRRGTQDGQSRGVGGGEVEADGITGRNRDRTTLPRLTHPTYPLPSALRYTRNRYRRYRLSDPLSWFPARPRRLDATGAF